MDTFVIYILFYHNKNFHTHTKQKRVEAKPWHMSLWKESKGLGHVIWT